MKTPKIWLEDTVNDRSLHIAVLDGTEDEHTQREFMQQPVDLGTSAWGHAYRFRPQSVYRVSRSFARAHYDQRIYKRKELIVQYLTSSAVRSWCDSIGMTILDIRDMRGTTSWYDSVVLPRAGQWYAEYHQGQHREALDSGLYHFIKTLMAAIVLTEETTFMEQWC